MAGAGPVGSSEPGASSPTPMWVQGHKNLGHSPLLSQFVSRELVQKWNS